MRAERLGWWILATAGDSLEAGVRAGNVSHVYISGVG